MTPRWMFYVLTLLFAASNVWADDDNNGGATMGATLSGANEIPTNLSTGIGTVSLKVTEAPASISVTIKYSGLTGNAAAAHLHLGNRWENGPVVVTICGSSGRQCPAQGTEQTFTFPLTNAITAIPAQAFTADVATLIRALDNGVIYANVHTSTFPGGEIRGQMGHGRGRSMGNNNPGRGNGRDKPKN